MAQGTPEDVARSKKSITARYPAQGPQRRGSAEPDARIDFRGPLCYTPAMARRSLQTVKNVELYFGLVAASGIILIFHHYPPL